MKEKADLYDVSAEFLLNYLYPEKVDEWFADCRGAFARNYSADLLEIDEEQQTVKLSRDSFLNLLPQGLLTTDDEFTGEDFKEKFEALNRKIELLHDLFSPVDTMFFRYRLNVEKELSELLRDQLSFLLKNYYNFDWEAEMHPIVRKIAPLLIFVKRYRADFSFIKDLIRKLFDKKIEMKIGQYTWGEDSDQAQPYIRYNIIVEGLNAEEYAEIAGQAHALNEFLNEWFIPFDTYCVIAVKEHGQDFKLNNNLILDYNTESNSKNI